jgi:hypothetical protein
MHAVTDLEGSHTDQQVSKRRSQTSNLILAIELPCAKGNGNGDWIDGHRSQQFLDKFLPVRFSVRGVSSSRSMRQLNQRHNGNTNLNFGPNSSRFQSKPVGRSCLAVRLRSRHWSRGSVPCRRNERFTMGCDCGLHVLSEIWINRCGRVFGGARLCTLRWYAGLAQVGEERRRGDYLSQLQSRRLLAREPRGWRDRSPLPPIRRCGVRAWP